MVSSVTSGMHLNRGGRNSGGGGGRDILSRGDFSFLFFGNHLTFLFIYFLGEKTLKTDKKDEDGH